MANLKVRGFYTRNSYHREHSAAIARNQNTEIIVKWFDIHEDHEEHEGLKLMNS